jgi:hypothetical protein
MYRSLATCILTVIIWYAISCTSFVEKRRNVLIVLIDYSASADELALDGYISVVTDIILPHMGQFDCLIVVPIDEGSKISPVKLVSEDLVNIGFRKPTDGFSHAEDSLRKRISEYIKMSSSRIRQELKNQKSLRRKYTAFTDIMGGIHQTTNLIEINEQDDAMKDVEDFVIGRVRLRSENTIILLSDMIQDSHEYNFNRQQGITTEQTLACLEKLKKQQSIPDLSGCNIFVIGATGRTSVQIDNVRYFWQEYFKQANANLHAYGFNVDGRLRKFLIESHR